MSKTKKALISVFYKDGILDFARYLAGNGWEILSTGGTKKHLQENGVPVTDVASVTGFPECLDGRVKTLHPHIHAGLLAVRDNPAHMAALEQAGIDPIDLVCVNLYPFFEKVQAGLSFAETVEFIDIGGPTMLRAAAKNWQDVLVLTDPADYPETEAALTASGQNASAVPAELKRRLAGKVFNLTSAYDAAVSRFMLAGEDFPAYFDVPLKKSMTLRYGENGHQKAALYLTADKTGAFGGMEQLQGKELSYNNIRDLDVAWKAVCAFTRHLRNGGEIPGNDFSAYNGILAGKDAAGNPADPCGTPVSVHFSGAAGKVFTIALKHNTPCGAALGGSVLESYRKTYNCDPVSVFGGIIGCSAEIDKAAAEEMIQCFLEVIVAPSFTEEALEVFRGKKNLRIVRASVPAEETLDFLSVDGGVLVQDRDNELFRRWNFVTKAKPTQEQIEEMAFGMTVAMFAKSNAVLVVKDGAAVGIGCGQTNRIWAAGQALERARENTEKAGTSCAQVLVSDAFFPFSDCVEKAAEYGITAIVQPGGSIRDQESIDACNRHNIAMVFTETRHFKH
ncbi:MAG: bifunctional phosphoribosylaminoimidazolecarboxamide formyltransferase/inosine monophosphate cyclohydrolase [Spirochaetes bacterium]|uniref:Bifunctional purine biosynthesis protein PurH n=1 Tax=Candidatus Avitreponema avistercoris TaxID=2840705 RepID=A0A9D9ELK2_9SPIR|nr:bifunctional phosphoribosylaminoimidazolecarboxamide formyltransferase/inosine monophosphate cyclohydrolase [Candidatus Avitreponema avistercoris]